MAGKNVKISILSNFFIAFVLEGLQRLSGLFVLELIQLTSVSRQNASVPFIFSWVVSNIIASFSFFLTDNKNSEYVILFGSLLSATGAALCILATNIITLTVFWGLIFGSGHGLASPHFFKLLKNGNSTKLSFLFQVTPSLGVTIMPFVLNVLNSYYGLQGSCLIFCGIILNYLPLAIAAAYNIEIRIPNINWRVRKKSKQYFVTKQDAGKAVSIECFINSLEPDLILKICQNGKSQDETMKNDKSDFFTHVVPISTGRKRSDTKGNNDLKGLEIDTNFFPRNRTPSQMVVEIKNYKKERKVFEESFNNKYIVHDEIEHTVPKTDCNINCDIINSIKNLEIKKLNTETESDLNLKNILDKISECEINESVGENTELKKLENYTGNTTALAHICVLSANAILQNLVSNTDDNTLLTEEKIENETEILPKKEFQTLKSSEKKPQQLPYNLLENKPAFNIPLDIKVHVEECTFKTDEEYLADSFNSKYLKDRKNSYRNHSNSVMLDMHRIIDFSNQSFSKKFLKCSELHKSKLSSIYSISENSEIGDSNIIFEKKHYQEKNNSNKAKRIFKFISGISSRVCFCILIIKIIFEINLVTLLTMFADFGNDVDNVTSDFKWILVAFGVGGVIGKICCFKISRTIPEKYHAIGVVLFLLTGLSTAGILYSPNLNWLAGFYCILGALEGGITYIIPKFILEYIDKDVHSTLSSVASFLSGVAIICIPYVIGIFRDELGDYEFLLQILSCSSVLCAFLAYFLPYLRTVPNKQISPSFRRKMETA